MIDSDGRYTEVTLGYKGYGDKPYTPLKLFQILKDKHKLKKDKRMIDKLEVGKTYECRDDYTICYIVAYDKVNDCFVGRHEDGVNYYKYSCQGSFLDKNRNSDYDIMREYKEPKTVSGWVNVFAPPYSNKWSLGCLYPNKEYAISDFNKIDHCVGFIKLDNIEIEEVE